MQLYVCGVYFIVTDTNSWATSYAFNIDNALTLHNVNKYFDNCVLTWSNFKGQ